MKAGPVLVLLLAALSAVAQQSSLGQPTALVQMDSLLEDAFVKHLLDGFNAKSSCEPPVISVAAEAYPGSPNRVRLTIGCHNTGTSLDLDGRLTVGGHRFSNNVISVDFSYYPLRYVLLAFNDRFVPQLLSTDQRIHKDPLAHSLFQYAMSQGNNCPPLTEVRSQHIVERKHRYVDLDYVVREFRFEVTCSELSLEFNGNYFATQDAILWTNIRLSPKERSF